MLRKHTENQDQVSVEGLHGDRNRPSRRYPPGRVCALNDCGTRLSVARHEHGTTLT